MMPAPVKTYTTLAGEWGWVCGTCRAESRYVYGSRLEAERLALRHARTCRARRRAMAGRP